MIFFLSHLDLRFSVYSVALAESSAQSINGQYQFQPLTKRWYLALYNTLLLSLMWALCRAGYVSTWLNRLGRGSATGPCALPHGLALSKCRSRPTAPPRGLAASPPRRLGLPPSRWGAKWIEHALRAQEGYGCP